MAGTSRKRSSLRKLATPAAAATFFLMGSSGVLLFFHLAERQVKEMHEWVGIVFVAAVLLHLVLNWRAFLAYFKRGPAIYAAFAMALIAATAFVGASLDGTERPRPPNPVAEALQDATLAELAVALHTTPDTLSSRLVDAGMGVTTESTTVRAIATTSGMDAERVLRTLTTESTP